MSDPAWWESIEPEVVSLARWLCRAAGHDGHEDVRMNLAEPFQYRTPLGLAREVKGWQPLWTAWVPVAQAAQAWRREQSPPPA